MLLQNVEDSFLRYLYEKLEVAQGIKVFESINIVDFTSFTKWVVIDTLTNSTSEQPKQLYFLHIATQKGLKNEKAILTSLVDTVMAIVKKYSDIPVYDTTSGLQIGGMMVSETSLSAVMQHVTGGNFRSITLGVVYSA